MRKSKTPRWASYLFILLVFVLTFLLFYWLFFFTYYIHESGHIIFGFLDGLLKGHINKFSIGAWVNHPITPFIKLPQQTKLVEGLGSLNFALGGPVFSMAVFLCLSLFAYSRSKNKAWFLLFVSTALFEIYGDFICGTDNPGGNPLSVCSGTLNIGLQYFATLLFAGALTWITSGILIERLKIRKQ